MLRRPLQKGIGVLAVWALLLTSCSAGALNSITGNISNAGSANSDGNSGGNNGESSFQSGEPVDIPITIAKSIKPVRPTTVLATPTGPNVFFSAQADPNAAIDVYDKNSSLIAQVNADGSGNFSLNIPLASLPYEDPVSFVVRDGEDLSPAVTVRAYSDLTFTVGVTRQPFQEAETNDYEILSGYDLAYSDACEGVIYNARHEDGHYALLCTRIDDADTVIIDASLAGPLRQLQVDPDGEFLVGLNDASHIVHVNLSNGAETVISDGPSVASAPAIRLSPNGDYVATTVDTGSLPHLASIEPTSFTQATKNSDRILINEGIVYLSMVECDWPGNASLLCLAYNPNRQPGEQYRAVRYDLTGTFASGNSRPILTDPPEVSYDVPMNWKALLRNLRMNPIHADPAAPQYTPHFLYEMPETTLYLSSASHDISTVNTDYFHTMTLLRDARWAPDGLSYNYAVAFSDSIHPEDTKIFREAPEGMLMLDDDFRHAGFGTNPLPIGADTTAYLCKDADDKEQVCVINWNKLN